MEKKNKTRSTVAGVVFVGCLFIGLALGILFNKTVVGLLLGLGIGFIAMGIIWTLMIEKRNPENDQK